MARRKGRLSSVQETFAPVTFPTGSVSPFAGSTAPDGWLLCDGSAVSRTTYAALFAVIGTDYGAGDGVSTFNLPDTQGVFLRGAGTQTISAVTYTATKGTKQADALQNITGEVSTTDDNAFNMNARVKDPSGAFSAINLSGYPINSNTVPSLQTFPAVISFDASRIARTSTETRPANIGINHIIKL